MSDGDHATDVNSEQGRSRRIAAILLVGGAVLLAFLIDSVLVPRTYPVAAAYGVALLLAARLLPPRALLLATCLALAVSISSNLLQGAPLAAWLPDNASLLLLGTLAWLLARQMEVARSARRASEASQREAELLLDRERVARRQADDAVRLRDQFLASASHDLRGPLTTLRGYAGIARRALETEDGPRALGALTNIDSSAKRLATALDELLDLAQLQAGQQLALRLQAMDLVALLRGIAADYEATAEAVSIRVETKAPTVWGTWDSARLERALENLISNAVKYSAPGTEITVAVDLQRDPVGRWAIVQVCDHGVGIPAADLPYVFERFHRATNVSGNVPGTGLGLPGARDIVQQHGGDISVESEEGYGSTFTVRLPLGPLT